MGLGDPKCPSCKESPWPKRPLVPEPHKCPRCGFVAIDSTAYLGNWGGIETFMNEQVPERRPLFI